MHSDRLLEHFRNPRNVGSLAPPALAVEVSNPACGDVLRLSAELDGGAVKAARYQVMGCTASIAAGSVLTELLLGRSKAEVAALRPSDIEEALGGLSAESKHAAVLAADGARALARSIESK